MKKKFDWNKPITWRGFGKLYGILTAISMAMLAVGAGLVLYGGKIVKRGKEMIKKIKVRLLSK